MGLVVGGLAALVVGLLLLGFGLVPVKGLVDAVGPVFGGGSPPDDLSERLDASMAALKARALWDGVGFLLVIGGFVTVKVGLAKPQKSVEQLVSEEVERRMAAGAVPAGAPPAMQPAGPPAQPPPAPFSPAPRAGPTPMPVAAPPTVPRTHCAACGSVLVAGGRVCPRGHAQV